MRSAVEEWGFFCENYDYGGYIMALIKCLECRGQVLDKAPTCVNCGFPLQTNDLKIIGII